MMVRPRSLINLTALAPKMRAEQRLPATWYPFDYATPLDCQRRGCRLTWYVDPHTCRNWVQHGDNPEAILEVSGWQSDAQVKRVVRTWARQVHEYEHAAPPPARRPEAG